MLAGFILIDHILITNFYSYKDISLNIISFRVSVKLIDKLALQIE